LRDGSGLRLSPVQGDASESLSAEFFLRVFLWEQIGERALLDNDDLQQ